MSSQSLTSGNRSPDDNFFSGERYFGNRNFLKEVYDLKQVDKTASSYILDPEKSDYESKEERKMEHLARFKSSNDMLPKYAFSMHPDDEQNPQSQNTQIGSKHRLNR
mmetsp:Transcript_37425/g.57334  ORF Transcript_37425/g.57334 Transcript_37425/m.57334 type:complete len:107 (+) Transcript_37425:1268-1588(+)|eukprot:CAMPEP_0170495112 /NCGR_PEP_ID=MMETSP0208-20121228/15021_1 /TAXON_ID=197538 /ORGANISM="Strombidium inclinatum, Strain S3" /LENGTH=106 /DNA_ID=CAMNT_0010771255 /DNA_START=1268 /DNA_END=1588 /DNA_ORIENTATION=-